MSDVKLPLSRRHLDIAIERLASRFGEAQRIRRAVANTIVAQLMPDCVIKGGSSLKFRYGDIATRVTKDMDAAQGADLDAFIARLDEALHSGWSGFTGHVVRRAPSTPADVPPAYVMHPLSGRPARDFSLIAVARHGRQRLSRVNCGMRGTRLQSTICPSRQRLPRRLIGQTI